MPVNRRPPSKSKMDQIATILTAMTYSELMDMAWGLSNMIEPEVRAAPKEASDFASMLSDWAEAQ